MPLTTILIVMTVQDCTAELTLKAGACVLRHLINMCYGVTIRLVICIGCDYDFLVQIDRDGQHDASSIPKLIKPLIEGHADLLLVPDFSIEKVTNLFMQIGHVNIQVNSFSV